MKGLRYTLNSLDIEYIENISKKIESLFGIEATIKKNKDGSTNVDACSNIIGLVFEELVGRDFDKKLLSNYILQNMTTDFAKGLLNGLYRGDGCALINGMQLDMSNPMLVKQIRDISYGLGLNTKYREYTSQSGSPSATLTLLFKYKNELDFVKYVNKNIDKIDFNYYSENRFNKFITKETITSSNGEIYLLNKVKSVEEIENTDEHYVYNLHVKDNHTYVVNNVVVHNCFLLGINDSLTDIYKAVDFASQLLNDGSIK